MVNISLDEAREKLVSLQRRMAAYDHAMGLMINTESWKRNSIRDII